MNFAVRNKDSSGNCFQNFLDRKTGVKSFFRSKIFLSGKRPLISTIVPGQFNPKKRWEGLRDYAIIRSRGTYAWISYFWGKFYF